MGQVVSKEGKPCVYLVAFYWSVLSLNRRNVGATSSGCFPFYKLDFVVLVLFGFF